MLPIVRRRSEPDTLAPDGSEIRLLVTGPEQDITRGSLCEVCLPEGQVSIPIVHRTVEEIWYVLAGRGEVWRQLPNEEVRTVIAQPGDALPIPRSCRFQFRSLGPGPFIFLCLTMPPWPGPDEAVLLEEGGWPVLSSTDQP
ncbi:MAG: cupin domain-containing protein [Armatimonadetes bacterium]|nr:cupin domain-containing protein [Armatimonadota bacterium]